MCVNLHYMNEKRLYPVLTIAGSDCSGGAGIQADIKVISAHGCYAMAAITSITAQNTTGVSAIEGVSPAIVGEQIRMVYSDIRPLAVKTGMLYSADIVHEVALTLADVNVDHLVIDPVMVSTSGSRLISEDAVDIMVKELFPLAELITPNRMEAEVLTGVSDPLEQGTLLMNAGCKSVLIKGGDSNDTEMKEDLLFLPGGEIIPLQMPAVDSLNTHGTGCSLSSAIASNLAKGMTLHSAVSKAKSYIYNAILSGAEYRIGRGHGPINHFYHTDFGCD